MELGELFGNVKAPKAHLFALLTESVANVSVDFDREVIRAKNIGVPFDFLGLGESHGSGYDLTFQVKETYSNPDGKFSEVYGNAVLIDCRYILDRIVEEIYAEVEKIKPDLPPEAYNILIKILDDIKTEIDTNGINLCQVAY